MRGEAVPFGRSDRRGGGQAAPPSRTGEDLHVANLNLSGTPACPPRLPPSQGHHMTNTTTGEALATSAALFLADRGAKLEAAGSRLMGVALNLKARAEKSKIAAPGAIAAALLLLSMHPAAAQTAGGSGSLETFLTNVVNEITGTAGQCLAVIAVALSGIGAMFGAMSFRAFGGVILGCAIVFSAAWVVGKITGGSVSL